MKWGNCTISNKEVDANGKITLHGDVNPDDKDFKGTKKLTWITVDKNTNFEVTLVEFDHIITKKKVEENDKVQDIVNRNSRIPYTAIAEGNMRSLQQGQIIQLERRGYFFVDKIETVGKQMILNYIPDGKQSNMSKITSKLDQKEVAGGKNAQSVAEQKKSKKAAAAEKPVGEDGEVKLSKKELNKLAAKQKRAAAKAGAPTDGPTEAANKGGAKKAPVAAAAKPAGSGLSAEQLKRLGECEAALANQQFMAGSTPSSVDRETWEEFKQVSFHVSAASHPHFFSWMSLVMKFNDNVRNGW
jgi:hypothetical protein